MLVSVKNRMHHRKNNKNNKVRLSLGKKEASSETSSTWRVTVLLLIFAETGSDIDFGLRVRQIDFESAKVSEKKEKWLQLRIIRACLLNSIMQSKVRTA